MEWTRGRVIGQGSSTSTVSVAAERNSGRLIAIKSVELSKSEFLKKEGSILSKVKSPQIIAYEGCNVTFENGTLMYNLCMEFASHGTIIDAIRRNGRGLDESMIRSYTCHILRGLVYLHSNAIVHCDIKGSNILITSEGAKIGDFGCAKTAGDTPISGTPLFMAPEVAGGEQQGYPADIWALGCTIIEMATGQAPWITGFSDPISAIYSIGFSNEVPKIPTFMSKKARDFLSKCFKRNPVERWSANELLDHDFLKNPDSNTNEVSGSNSVTPTSVLDHELWESKEELTLNSENLAQMDSSESSPVARFQRLNEATTTPCLGLSGWDWESDESWVTVRNIDTAGQDYSLLNPNNRSSGIGNHSYRMMNTLVDSLCNIDYDPCVKKNDLEIIKENSLFSSFFITILVKIIDC